MHISIYIYIYTISHHIILLCYYAIYILSYYYVIKSYIEHVYIRIELMYIQRCCCTNRFNMSTSAQARNPGEPTYKSSRALRFVRWLPGVARLASLYV